MHYFEPLKLNLQKITAVLILTSFKHNGIGNYKTHINTHIHICMHTHTHTYTHIYTCTCTHTHTDAHTQI